MVKASRLPCSEKSPRGMRAWSSSGASSGLSKALTKTSSTRSFIALPPPCAKVTVSTDKAPSRRRAMGEMSFMPRPSGAARRRNGNGPRRRLPTTPSARPPAPRACRTCRTPCIATARGRPSAPRQSLTGSVNTRLIIAEATEFDGDRRSAGPHGRRAGGKANRRKHDRDDRSVADLAVDLEAPAMHFDEAL